MLKPRAIDLRRQVCRNLLIAGIHDLTKELHQDQRCAASRVERQPTRL